MIVPAASVGTRGGRLVVCVASLVATMALVVPLRAWGHIEVGEKSLQWHVAQADLVVRARIVDPAAVFALPDAHKRRPVVDVRVLEIIKGAASHADLRFAQHGHGVARFVQGSEAILFLKRIERSRELARLAVPGGPTHFSSQEHDEAFVVEPRHGETLVGAVRDFARAADPGLTPGERIAFARSATLGLLLSGDARLGALALAGLVASPGAPLLVAEDTSRLRPLLDRSELSVGFRAGLLAELERRGWLDATPLWRALVERARPGDLPAAIRAAGRHPSPAVDRLLLELVGDPRGAVAAEAARALGRPGGSTFVPTLAKALAHEEARVRNAAIRGLRAIGDEAARRALSQAADGHPDPRTRRLAAGAARALADS